MQETQWNLFKADTTGAKKRSALQRLFLIQFDRKVKQFVPRHTVRLTEVPALQGVRFKGRPLYRGFRFIGCPLYRDSTAVITTAWYLRLLNWRAWCGQRQSIAFSGRWSIKKKKRRRKNEEGQKNDMDSNVLLFNHTLLKKTIPCSTICYS